MKMHSLSAQEILTAWEAGLTQRWAQRALTLLAAASPDTSSDSLAKLSIGQRDTELVRLRELIFGPHLAGLSRCPGCGLCIEFSIDAPQLLSGSAGQSEAEVSLDIAGYSLRWRPPTSEDLMAMTRDCDPAGARQQMLERSLISINYLGKPACLDDLLPEIVDALVQHMAKADPLADITLAMSCPQCDRHWQAVFDIVTFLWSEIEVWARLIMRDVHILASAYGWAERDILTLSPLRRRFYLEMVGA